MIRFLFDLMGACAHFLWALLGALFDLAMRLVSAAATVLSWPFRAFGSLLSTTFSWMPFFLTVCLVLAGLLVLITLLALISRGRRHFK